jgi:hypothetical protein
MSLNNITSICRSIPAVFTINEANALIPLIQRISAKHEIQISKALALQRWYMKSGASQSRVTDCDNRVVAELQALGRKILKLGVKQTQGGWFLFDTGYGYWVWTIREPEVEYYCDYLEKPEHRRKVFKARIA